MASNDEVKMNYGKIKKNYSENENYVRMSEDDPYTVEKTNKSYKDYYKDRIKAIYENDSIPMSMIKEILNAKQK